MYDLVIIGAGPAGLTAGYELAKTDKKVIVFEKKPQVCLLYTSPSPRDHSTSRMPSSA